MYNQQYILLDDFCYELSSLELFHRNSYYHKNKKNHSTLTFLQSILNMTCQFVFKVKRWITSYYLKKFGIFMLSICYHTKTNNSNEKFILTIITIAL